jgi:hypothetical protein
MLTFGGLSLRTVAAVARLLRRASATRISCAGCTDTNGRSTRTSSPSVRFHDTPPVSIHQHPSAYISTASVSIRLQAFGSTTLHLSAYISIRQPTCQHTSASVRPPVSIHQHPSACVSSPSVGRAVLTKPPYKRLTKPLYRFGPTTHHLY